MLHINDLQIKGKKTTHQANQNELSIILIINTLHKINTI
jgi:hypothetical protein